MLRITKQSDYGIVLMTLFAARPSSDARLSSGVRPSPGATAVAEPMSARDLAEATGLPLPMVGKILKLLVRDGLLVSQRGAKGGYRLGRPAARITVEEIVTALEGPIAITECTGGGETDCRFTGACTLQPNWRRINQALRQALRGITLLDMITPEGEPGASPPAGRRAGAGCPGGLARATAALESLGEARP